MWLTFPDWNPQHADAQSASEVQAPVMNCVPGAFASVSAAAGGGVVGVAGTAGALAFAWPAWPAWFCPPWVLARALLFGWASPKPHSSPLSFATKGAAHLPDVKPQQAEAHSASEAHVPVMNWVPWAAAYRETLILSVEDFSRLQSYSQLRRVTILKMGAMIACDESTDDLCSCRKFRLIDWHVDMKDVLDLGWMQAWSSSGRLLYTYSHLAAPGSI